MLISELLAGAHRRKTAVSNTLFYGDNLDILREPGYFPDECVDLIYLDPPFNSNRSYSVLFKDESGRESQAQITAFDDTWHWGDVAEQTYRDMAGYAPEHVLTAVGAIFQMFGRNQMMAYLVMMAARLVELHRVLKPTGSLYLHCDPTASHYLKIILDTIFGPENFRNEVIWKRTGAHSGTKGWGPIHDTLFFYSKSNRYIWNQQYEDYDQSYIDNYYNLSDEKGRYQLVTLTAAGVRHGESGDPWRGVNPTDVGRHWAIPRKVFNEFVSLEEADRLSTQQKLDLLDAHGLIYWPPKGNVPRLKRYLEEAPGTHIQDIVTDILPLSSQAAERLGYPTQKPLALLDRIVAASSNLGDVVLDPFCGCGTAIAAAHILERQWIGIDITHLSVALIKYRLSDMFGLKARVDYRVIGEPEDIAGARYLAETDSREGRFEFQFWAASLVHAQPPGGTEGSRQGRKGKDRGIDGVITFLDGIDQYKRIIVQVKSGKVSSRDIRDLVGTIDREGAVIGVFITLEPPTKDMVTEALSAGVYQSLGWQNEYPRIQILTIEELLEGAEVQMPPQYGTFKRAGRITKPPEAGQLGLFDEGEE
jgi:site-specific DNA-methyltransferase (adenine-specific)